VIRTIDAHAAGAPLRLIVEGFSSRAAGPCSRKAIGWPGTQTSGAARCCSNRAAIPTCAARSSLSRFSRIARRRTVHAQPRGCTMSGHGIIAATTIVLERGLIVPGGDGTRVVYDTPAGVIRAQAYFRTETAGACELRVAGGQQSTALHL
jgi:proline racemase